MATYPKEPPSFIFVAGYVGQDKAEHHPASMRYADALQKQRITNLEYEIQRAIDAGVDRRDFLEELFELKGENRRTERRLAKLVERRAMLAVLGGEVREKKLDYNDSVFLPEELESEVGNSVPDLGMDKLDVLEGSELEEEAEWSIDTEMLNIDVYQMGSEACQGCSVGCGQFDDILNDFYGPEDLFEEPTLKILAGSFFQSFNMPPGFDNNCLICTAEMPNAEEELVDENGTFQKSDILDLWAVDRPLKTPCNHIIGARCLWRWMFDEQKYTCPCCRQDLFGPLEEIGWYAPLVVNPHEPTQVQLLRKMIECGFTATTGSYANLQLSKNSDSLS